MATGGWSGLFDRVGGAAHDLLIPRGHTHARRVRRIVGSRGGKIAAERVFTDLEENFKQVTHTPAPGSTAVHGGLVTIGTIDPTPQTSANFINYVEKNNKPDTYPTDASGNGGGGKAGLRL